MKIFVVDNYDSFTFNLVHYLESFHTEVDVKRNDECSIKEIEEYDRIVLSPGPGLPSKAGQMNEIINTYHRTKPILGICLGHQALIEFYGGKIHNLNDIYHGESSIIDIDNSHFIFNSLNTSTEVGRYHSWGAYNAPKNTSVIARKDNIIMGIQHHIYPSIGLQFHPESIMTIEGIKMIENWINHNFN